MDVPVSESDVVVTNGETSVKGGPLPPPSPLTGCYLLIVVGEPYSEEHKEIILQRIAKGLLSWDMENCHVDLEKELQAITDVAPEGEEARHGERLIQFATENLVTEVLIHPAANTLIQCMKNLLSSFTRHRHIIHSGYTFGGNGSWALQDGTFSLADFTEAFQENDVQRVIKAYENTITIDIHCSNEGDWSKLPKESYTKNCKVQVNPNDVLSSGSSSINSFVNYLSIYLLPADIESLLESSDVVGNIRFSHPTLYVFPGGQGDAALFGINGFNMLVDGGYARKACFWDFTRHLDRLDAVLVTRLNNSNVCGVSSVLKRKTNNQVYPQIGHFFCNLQERKAISPDGDKDKDPLLINLLYEGQDIISNLRQLNLRPQLCYRDTDPINLYHKVGHGTLDMYVLSPAKHSKEVKEFLHKWNTNDQRLFTTRKDPKEFSFPLSNLVSICALLVWKPANPSDTITRLLFPGSTPQHKIFEGLDRLKHLEFMKHPVCSAKSLTPSGSILGLTKSKQTKTTTVLDKILPSEQRTQKILDMKPLKERTPPQSENKQKIENKNEIKKLIEVNGTACEENKISKAEKVIKSNSVESDKSEPRSDTKKTELVNGKDVDILEDKSDPKQKTKVAESKPKQRMSSKVRSESTRRSIEKKPKIERKVELKPAPTTPKKTVDAKVNGVAKEKDVPKPKLLSRVGLKPSPTSTPAKSTKDANNRKVVELKFRPGLKKEPIAKKEPAKLYERKPISRRPKAASPVRATKTPASPSKKLPGIKTDKNGVSRTIKLDKEGTTDSSAVSTPSADQDTSKKIDESKLTKTELEELKAKEIADLKEEQEVVKEIEAVFRKDEKLNDSDQSDTRKIKDISIEEKTTEGDDEEEYIIVEKEEVEQNTDSVNEQESATKEDEIQKHQRDSEESEKPRKKSDAEKSGEKIPIVEEVPAKIEPEIQETKLIEAETCRVLEIVQPLVKEVEEIIIPTAEMTRSKEDSREKTEEMSKEVSVTSPEDKIDMSSEKKLTDTRGDVEEEENKEEKDQNYVLESQPDEKFSATIESGATTAPTLPEDERITLDEIKEDQVIEEKYAKEETKEEKEIPAVVVTQKPLEAISKISPIVGIKFEAHQSHIRDIVKTPDEVADLPMHEEVDIDTYDFPSAFKKDNKKMEAPIQKEQDESVKPIDKNEVKIDVVKVEPEEIETVEIKTAVEEKPEIQIQEVRLTEDKEDEKDIEAVIQDVTTETKVTVVIEQPSERTEEVLQEAQLQIKETIDETIENVPQETVASAEEIKITEQDIKLESTEVKEVDQDKEQAIDVPEDKTKDESTKLNETEQEIKDEVREQVETKEDGTEVEKEEEVKEENIDISIPTEIKDKVGDIMTTIKDAIAEITSASIQTEDLKQDETVIAPVAEEIDSAQIDESEAIIIKTITEPQVESVDDQQQDKTAVISDAKEIITDIIEEAERKTSIVEDTVIELSTIVAPETKLDAAEDIIEVKEEIDEMFVESKHPYKEEEIVKIVSSVALVLKSDAPLEELAATLPMEYGSPFKSFGLKGYTTELRETHITTLDSPVQEDAALPGKETYREDFAVCPKQSSIEFIDEEKKIAIPDPIISETQEKDISPQEKKISDLIKDSNALIASTSKIISDIKSAAVVDEVITEEHKAEDIKKTSEVLEDAEEIKKTSEVLEDADEIKKTCEVLEDAEEIKKTSEVLEDTEEIKKTSEVLEDVEVIKKTSEVLEDAKELSEKTEAANELIEKIEEDSNDIEALDVTEDTLTTKTTGTVHRMLVTASSEDGGEETVICPSGSITFTKEDSGKSSPEKTLSTKSTPHEGLSARSTPEPIEKESIVDSKDEAQIQETNTEKNIDGKDSTVEEISKDKEVLDDQDDKIEKDTKETEIKTKEDDIVEDNASLAISSPKLSGKSTPDIKIEDQISDKMDAKEDIQSEEKISKDDHETENTDKDLIEKDTKTEVDDRKASDGNAEVSNVKIDLKQEKQLISDRISPDIKDEISDTSTKEDVETVKELSPMTTEHVELKQDEQDIIKKDNETADEIEESIVLKDVVTITKTSVDSASTSVGLDKEEDKSTKIEPELEGEIESSKLKADVKEDAEQVKDLKNTSEAETEIKEEIVDTDKQIDIDLKEEKEISEKIQNELEDQQKQTEVGVKEDTISKQEKTDDQPQEKEATEILSEIEAQDVIDVTKIAEDLKDISTASHDNEIQTKSSVAIKESSDKAIPSTSAIPDVTSESAEILDIPTVDLKPELKIDISNIEKSGKSSPDLVTSGTLTSDIKEDLTNAELSNLIQDTKDCTGKSTPELNEDGKDIPETIADSGLKLEEMHDSGMSPPELKATKEASGTSSPVHIDEKKSSSGKSSPKRESDIKELADDLEVSSGMKDDKSEISGTESLVDKVVEIIEKTADVISVEEAIDIKEQKPSSGKTSPKLESQNKELESIESIPTTLKEQDAPHENNIDEVDSGKSSPNLKDDRSKSILSVTSEKSGKSTPNIKEDHITPVATPEVQDIKDLSGKSTPDIKLTGRKSIISITSEQSGKSTPDLKPDDLPSGLTVDVHDIKDLSGRSTPEIKINLSCDQSGKSSPDLEEHVSDIQDIIAHVSSDMKPGDRTSIVSITSEQSGKSTPDLKASPISIPNIHDIKTGSEEFISDIKPAERKSIVSLTSEQSDKTEDDTSPRATPDILDTKVELITAITEKAGESTPEVKALASEVHDTKTESGKSTPDIKKEIEEPLISKTTEKSGKSTPDITTTPDVHVIKSESGKSTPDIKHEIEKGLSSEILEKSGKATPDITATTPEVHDIKIDSGKSTPDVKSDSRKSLTSEEADKSAIVTPNITASTPEVHDIKIESGKSTPDIKCDIRKSITSETADKSGIVTPDIAATTPDVHDIKNESGKSTPDIKHEIRKSLTSEISEKSGKSTPDITATTSDIHESKPESGKSTPDIKHEIIKSTTLETTDKSGKTTPDITAATSEVHDIKHESGKSTPDIKHEIRKSLTSETTEKSGKSTPDITAITPDVYDTKTESGKSTPDIKHEIRKSLTSETSEKSGKSTPDIIATSSECHDIKAESSTSTQDIKIDQSQIDDSVTSQQSGKSTPDIKTTKSELHDIKSESGRESPDIKCDVSETITSVTSTKSGKSTPDIKETSEKVHTDKSESGKSTPDIKGETSCALSSETSGNSVPDIKALTPEVNDIKSLSGKSTPDITSQHSGKSTPDIKVTTSDVLDTKGESEKTTSDVKYETTESVVIVTNGKSGKSTPETKATTPDIKLESGKTTPDIKCVISEAAALASSEKSGKSTPDIKSPTPEICDVIEESGKATPDIKCEVSETIVSIKNDKSGKSTPDIKEPIYHEIKSDSGKSTPDIKQDVVNNMSSLPNEQSGKSTPDIKGSSGKSTPDIKCEIRKSIISTTSDISGKSTPDFKVNDSAHDTLDKSVTCEQTGMSTPEPVRSTPDIYDVYGRSTPDEKCGMRKTMVSITSDQSGKSTPDLKHDTTFAEIHDFDHTLDMKTAEQSTMPISSKQSGTSTPDLKDESENTTTEAPISNDTKELSDKSTLDLQENDLTKLETTIVVNVKTDLKIVVPTEKDTKESQSNVITSELSVAGPSNLLREDSISSSGQISPSNKDIIHLSSEELHLSGKSTPDIADVERMKEIHEILKHEKHIPGSSTPPTVPVSPIVKETFTLQTEEQKLTEKKELSSVEEKEQVDEKELDITSISEITETVKQSGITTTSTTTTVTKKVVDDLQLFNVITEIPPASKDEPSEIPHKSTGLRCSTPGSDDCDFGGVSSPHSDISSGQMSRVPHAWGHGSSEEHQVYSDDDDVPGSPTSVTSQMTYSPSTRYTEFEIGSDKSTKIDPMISSFYGALPDDSAEESSVTSSESKVQSQPIPMTTKSHLEYSTTKDSEKRFLEDADLDFEKAMLEHRQTRGTDLISDNASDSTNYKYEITQAKYSKAIKETSMENGKDGIPMKDIAKNGFDKDCDIEQKLKTDSPKKSSEMMTSSFIEASSSNSQQQDIKKDPIETWGKPLGLPSPALPPSDMSNKTTPKKMPASATLSSKNKINDERKRSESPSKYKKNKNSSPVYLDLTYVPHHGNSYYSFVEFFKSVRARYYVFSGTEPSRDVYNALLEAKQTWEDKELEVTIIPTYDTDVLGYWVAENEDLLAKYKIDLSPSASRCTINLQDHETSCSAYRLEF